MPKPEDLRPMSEFDPSRRALVYDQLNDETFEWLPDRLSRSLAPLMP
jgi:hypothetical protein